jgi:hypothetical protein
MLTRCGGDVLPGTEAPVLLLLLSSQCLGGAVQRHVDNKGRFVRWERGLVSGL